MRRSERRGVARAIAVGTLCLFAATVHAAGRSSDAAAIACDKCDGWNLPHAPVQLHGNTFYVGVVGVSSVLVKTSDGLVLMDGGLPQSALHVAANIAALGFSLREVRYILVSHAHFDHAGAVATLKAMTGARVVASAPNLAALAAGHPLYDDPQFASGSAPAVRFPAVHQGRAIADRGTLVVGDVTFTAHVTGGHAPGSTTWTWRSCDDARCLDVVYADSLSAVADPAYRFGAHPEVVARLRRAIERVEQLPCDVLITTHPDLAAIDQPHAVDPAACRVHSENARQRLEHKLATER